jgi:hypothetical protein
MLASSAINNVFVTYSLDFFRNVSHVSPMFFYCGQLVYLVFNSLNDPIFGWLSDNTRGSGEEEAVAGTGGAATTGRGRPRGRFRQLRRRQNAIRVGGAIWALAFALTWWPWGASSEAGEAAAEAGATGAAGAAAGWSSSLLAGLHFVLCLCAYDGALTYVEVNHAAVLAEMTTSSAERADSNMMSAVAAAVGSGTSVIAHLCYDRADMTAFRVLALVIALGSIVAFELSAVGIGWETSALQEALGVSHRVVRVPSSQVTLVGAAGNGFGGTPGSSSSSSTGGGGGSYSPMAASGYSPMAPQSYSPRAGQGSSGRPMALQRSDGSSRSLPALADTGGSTAQPDAGVELRQLETTRHRQVAGSRPLAGEGGTPTVSKRRLTPLPAAGRGRKGSASGAGSAAPVSYRTFLGQLLSSRNIVVFIAFSALQTFDCTFEKSFFAPFSDIVVAAADVRSAGLLGSSGMDAGTLHRRGGETQTAALSVETGRSLNADDAPAHVPASTGHTAAVSSRSDAELGEGIVSRHSRSVIISLSFLLPHALTVVWTPLVSSWGMHGTLTTILLLRLGLLGSAALFHGLEPAQTASSAAVALGFMLSNRVLSESVCRLFPLVLSDLIDEDAVTHRRAHALSASLVGASAVFSKASQSLAPMIAFYVLPPDLGALLSSPGHRPVAASDASAAHVPAQPAGGPKTGGVSVSDGDAHAPRWRAYPQTAAGVGGRMLTAAGTDGEASGSLLFGRPREREANSKPSPQDASEHVADEGQASEAPAAEGEHASGAGSLFDAAAAAVVHAVEAAESGEEAALDTLMPLQSVQDLSAAVEAGIAQVESAAAAEPAALALVPREDAVAAPVSDSATVMRAPGQTGSAASSSREHPLHSAELPHASSAAAAGELLHVGQPPPATDADEVAAAAEVHVVLPPPPEPRDGMGMQHEGSRSGTRGSPRTAASQAAVLYAAASRVWGLLLAMPSVCVLLQLVLWRYGYTLYGKRLTHIKALADELAAAGLPGDGDGSGDDVEQPPRSNRVGASGSITSDEGGSDRLHRSA